MMAYSPGFPIRNVTKKLPNVGNHFFGGFSTSPVEPIAQTMKDPNLSLGVTQGYRFPMAMGENYLTNMMGTNLGKSMDDEVVEVPPPATMKMNHKEAEEAPKDGAFINKSVKNVNTIKNYFSKK